MKPAANAAFVRHEHFPWEEVGPGVKRQVLGHGPDLMMVRVEFEKGGVGTLHHHPHRQVTYVAAGSFEARVGEACEVLGPGDCFYVQADVEHGVVALEAGTLVDVFTPARADFLPPPPPPSTT
ncbi:MAG TPA: cupin domain-containing protein [Gemmatimonadaceae bacterium]